MPIFVPVLIGAGVLTLMGYGGKKGRDGVLAMSAARRVGREAEQRHRDHVALLEQAREQLTSELDALQTERIAYARTTLGRMVELLQALERHGKVHGVLGFARLGIQPEPLWRFKAQFVEVGGTLRGALVAAGAGAGASAAATSLVSVCATASTGAAISGLSGAAADSAILAWLGGGAVAAGGGGVAAGSLMLGGIAVAPAVAISGFVLAAQGEKALTKARAYVRQVDVAIAQLTALLRFQRRAEARVTELRNVTRTVDARAASAIGRVFAIVPSFDANDDTHVMLLSTAMLLAKALSDLLGSRVLDDDGMLDAASAEVLARHRYLVEER